MEIEERKMGGLGKEKAERKVKTPFPFRQVNIQCNPIELQRSYSLLFLTLTIPAHFYIKINFHTKRLKTHLWQLMVTNVFRLSAYLVGIASE